MVAVAVSAYGVVEPAARVSELFVIYGSRTGLTATGNQVWHQDTSGVRQTAEAATASATHSTNHRQRMRTRMSLSMRGRRGVMGRSSARRRVHPCRLPASVPGGRSHRDDELSCGKTTQRPRQAFPRSGLVHGMDYRLTWNCRPSPTRHCEAGLKSCADAGAVVVIYGTATATGLTATTANPAQFWHQDVSGANDTAQIGDRFGHSLY